MPLRNDAQSYYTAYFFPTEPCSSSNYRKVTPYLVEGVKWAAAGCKWKTWKRLIKDTATWDKTLQMSGSGYEAFLPSVLPVTLVPRPALSAGTGSEVSAAHVHDTGGEAQQAAVSIGPLHSGGRGGQAVLFVSAGQQVEGSVLQVGCLLDKLGIQYKVRSSCGGQDSELVALPLSKQYDGAHAVLTHFLHMWLRQLYRLLLWGSRRWCFCDTAGWTSQCQCSEFHSEPPQQHLKNRASTRSPAQRRKKIPNSLTSLTAMHKESPFFGGELSVHMITFSTLFRNFKTACKMFPSSPPPPHTHTHFKTHSGCPFHAQFYFQFVCSVNFFRSLFASLSLFYFRCAGSGRLRSL